LIIDSFFEHKLFYRLDSQWVLRNTSLDNRAEHFQVERGNEKYKNAEYDDSTVESLIKYLELENYEQLEDFLQHCHIPSFD
jgi:hypothetical protein